MDFVTAKQLLEMNIEEIPFLVEGRIPKGQVGGIVGESDAGKSTCIRCLGLQVVGGAEEIYGGKVNATHRRCLFVSTEDNRATTAFFLKKANSRFKYPPESTSRLEFLFEADRDFTTNLLKRLTEVQYDLIILDNLADLFAMANYNSLNDATQVRSFLQPFSSMADRFGCSIVFVHHLKKGRENEEPTKNNLNGSQAIEAKSRFILELRKDKHDPNKSHLCITKGNSFSAEQKVSSIELIRDSNLVFDVTGKGTPLSQLVPNQQNEMKNKVEAFMALGYTQAEAAKEFGFKSRSAISKILSKK